MHGGTISYEKAVVENYQKFFAGAKFKLFAAKPEAAATENRGDITRQNDRIMENIHPFMHRSTRGRSFQTPGFAVENSHFSTLSTDFSTGVFHRGNIHFGLHKSFRLLFEKGAFLREKRSRTYRSAPREERVFLLCPGKNRALRKNFKKGIDFMEKPRYNG